MRNIPANSGGSKPRRYMRLFKTDYRDGTAMLSLDAQGLYMRILTYLDDGDAVPADPVALARFLQCNPRTTRKLLPELISAGKLFEVDGQLCGGRP
jgi:hypothetical protein